MPKIEYSLSAFELLHLASKQCKTMNVSELEHLKEDLAKLTQLADKEIEAITSKKRLIEAVADH
ncbi:hypothetical protein MJH12_16965 [bacterium]|nr:hypothetical protein [bacterium]